MNDASPRPLILATPGFALGAADQFSAALWRAAVESNVTQPQFLALTELLYTPGIGHYELADRIGIDRATVGPILKRLIDQQWVDRQKDPRDSRRSVLTLCPAGRDLLREVSPLVRAMDAELMAALSPTEQAVVLQSWATIGQQLATCDDLQIRGATETDIPGLTHYAWFFLRKARRNYRRIWREVAGETLSPSQFSLLDVVAANPGIDIRTAAGMASVEESTALRIVMRLVRTRLMRDAADPNDARRRLLSLTEPGSQAHRQIQELVPRIQADLCAKIPPQVVKSFFELTCRVARLSTQKGRPPTVAPTPITHTRKRENPAPKKAATIKTADQGATLSTR